MNYSEPKIRTSSQPIVVEKEPSWCPLCNSKDNLLNTTFASTRTHLECNAKDHWFRFDRSKISDDGLITEIYLMTSKAVDLPSISVKSTQIIRSSASHPERGHDDPDREIHWVSVNLYLPLKSIILEEITGFVPLNQVIDLFNYYNKKLNKVVSFF